MSAREQLIAQWNSMSHTARYSTMQRELEEHGQLGTMAKEGIMSQAEQDKVISSECQWASKQRFNQLPEGLQEHALRGISAEYSLNQNYTKQWLPQRGVTYDRYPQKDRIYIGDFVHIQPHAQLSNGKTVAEVYGPEGTYGRVVGIRMAMDPVDSAAKVYLGDGKDAVFGYYALTKVDKSRLTNPKWRQLLTMIMGEQIHDISNRMNY